MSSTRWWMTIAAIGCAGLGLALALGPARLAWAGGAADAEVMLTIRPPDAKDPKARGDAPTIEATVIGAPNLPAERFALVDKSAKPPVQIKAAARRSFQQGPDTLAVAIVMLGWEMWIGNDSYRPKEDPTRAKGMLQPLRAALDKQSLKDAAPPGSVGALITYADAAKLRVPMGPLAKLSSKALGVQQDYKNTVGFELVKGVELGLAELRKTTSPRKVLIVVTDGEDTNEDTAKAQLILLKKQAQSDRIERFAIVYKAQDSASTNVIGRLTSVVSTVVTADDVGKALRSILDRVADRQYLTFPGYDKAARSGLAWDGRPHDLAILIDGVEGELQTLVLAPKWAPAAP